jgi:hypothetical protein
MYAMSELVPMSEKPFDDTDRVSHESLNINPSIEVKIINNNNDK